MADPHLLDRPILAMLTSRRQAGLAIVRGGAWRLDPAYGIFAVLADDDAASREALGQLVREHGDAGLVEAAPPPAIPGTRVVSEALCWQMIAEGPGEAGPAPALEILDLGPADAGEMLALATLTR